MQVVNSTLQASVQPPMLAYDLPPHICVSLQMSPSGCTHRFLSPLLWILWVCESWRNSSRVSSERCILPLTVYAQMDITPVHEVCSHIVLSCNNLHTISSTFPKPILLCCAHSALYLFHSLVRFLKNPPTPAEQNQLILQDTCLLFFTHSFIRCTCSLTYFFSCEF